MDVRNLGYRLFDHISDLPFSLRGKKASGKHEPGFAGNHIHLAFDLHLLAYARRQEKKQITDRLFYFVAMIFIITVQNRRKITYAE